MSKEYKRICSNFWCKAPYMADKDNIKSDPTTYRQCPKCRGFAELAGSVINNGEKDYKGERFDGKAHPIKIQNL